MKRNQPGHGNYGGEAAKLRVLKMPSIRAENDIKSRAEIWSVAKNVVTLQRQSGNDTLRTVNPNH